MLEPAEAEEPYIICSSLEAEFVRLLDGNMIFWLLNFVLIWFTFILAFAEVTDPAVVFRESIYFIFIFLIKLRKKLILYFL